MKLAIKNLWGLSFKRMVAVKILLGILAVASLYGCVINKNISPIDAPETAKICVEKNSKVLMDGFHPELISQMNELGIETETYGLERPDRCNRFMQYTANWTWDLAMYLSYLNIEVYEGNTLIGKAEYDARGGGARLDKFGTTAEIIRPIIKELFGKPTQ